MGHWQESPPTRTDSALSLDVFTSLTYPAGRRTPARFQHPINRCSVNPKATAISVRVCSRLSHMVFTTCADAAVLPSGSGMNGPSPMLSIGGNNVICELTKYIQQTETERLQQFRKQVSIRELSDREQLLLHVAAIG